VTEEVLLPVLLFTASAIAPSFCVFLVEGVAGGEGLPEGVPNWLRISLRLGYATWVLRLRTYKAKLLDQLVILRRLEIGLLRRQGIGSSTRNWRAGRLCVGNLSWPVEVSSVDLVRGVDLETALLSKGSLRRRQSSRE
jgi:hypothetical protein